jgi:hypothetical protein
LVLQVIKGESSQAPQGGLDLIVVHVAQDTVSAFHLSSGDHELDESRQTVGVRGKIIVIHFLRERETERETERERQRQRDRETERETERERKKERERGRQREIERDRER